VVRAFADNPRSALVVAHPGHELRIHGWLERARPLVSVLTDGSGGGGDSRLSSTRRILREAGATEGRVFGAMTDRDLYAAVMRGDAARFTCLAEELAGDLVAAQVDLVVSDAREGYNSAHDLCWFLVDAAVAIAEHQLQRRLVVLDFPLVANPAGGEGIHPPAMMFTLDGPAFERKLLAAQSYPEMAGEVQVALGRFGAKAFQIESLWPADRSSASDRLANGIPFYERYGEQQVAAGVYTEVLRQRDHVEPLVMALRRHVRERTGCDLSLSS
jgi:hypothetical protein